MGGVNFCNPYTFKVRTTPTGHAFLFSVCIFYTRSVNNFSKEQQALLRLSQNGPTQFFPPLSLTNTLTQAHTLRHSNTFKLRHALTGMLSHSHHYQRPHTPPTYQLLLFEEAVLSFPFLASGFLGKPAIKSISDHLFVGCFMETVDVPLALLSMMFLLSPDLLNPLLLHVDLSR